MRVTRALLIGVNNKAIYMEDKCVHTENIDDHIVTLSELFSRIQHNGLTFKPAKTVVGFSEVSVFKSHNK